MNYPLVTILLLTGVCLYASVASTSSLHRLARIASAGGRQTSSLARSLDGSGSSLARRVSEDVDFEDEDENIAKRQFDDYGHMRFGRNAPKFDEYGHMKYGK